MLCSIAVLHLDAIHYTPTGLIVVEAHFSVKAAERVFHTPLTGPFWPAYLPRGKFIRQVKGTKIEASDHAASAGKHGQPEESPLQRSDGV